MNSWSTKKIGNKFLQVRRQDWHNQALDIISLCRSLSTKTWLILTTYYWSPLEQFLPRLFLLLLLFFSFFVLVWFCFLLFVGLFVFTSNCSLRECSRFLGLQPLQLKVFNFPLQRLTLIRKYTIKHFICLFLSCLLTRRQSHYNLLE